MCTDSSPLCASRLLAFARNLQEHGTRERQGGPLETQIDKSHTTTSNLSDDESEIRQLMERVSEAVRTRSMSDILSAYAEDLVLFDVRDALKTDKEGLRRSWQECFESSREFQYKIKDLKFSIDEHAAFSFCLSHCTGLTTAGEPIDIWLRVTSCYKKGDRGWLVSHEHVSAPGDFVTGKILQDLKPEGRNVAH